MLTTQVITNSVSMPVCTYDILQGNNNGPPVRFVRIGDPVYHKWSCTTSAPDNFCMKVHSCSVDDGSGSNRVPVIDQNGCSVDQFVLGDLEYYGDLTVGREAHVFKFADHPLVFFNCQIELSLKDGETCEEKMPKCDDKSVVANAVAASRRRRRSPNGVSIDGASVNKSSSHNPTKNSNPAGELFKLHDGTAFFADFDLPPQELTVLDIDERLNAKSVSQSIQNELSEAIDEHGGSSGRGPSKRKMEVCLSPIGLAIVGTVACAITITSIITIFIVTSRKTDPVQKVS